MMNSKLGLNKRAKIKTKTIRVIIILIILVSVLCLLVNNSYNKRLNIKPDNAVISKKQFISTIAPYAEQTYRKHKIFASITLAQAMLESNTGNSKLTRKANNLFGIKAYKWTGKTIKMPTKEHYKGSEVVVMSTFRSYDNWDESIEDHTNFLKQNSTYEQHGVFKASNYTEQAEAIQAAGYATDPDYAKKLIALIKKYSLDKYDNVK